jgi:hypothetical protein
MRCPVAADALKGSFPFTDSDQSPSWEPTMIRSLVTARSVQALLAEASALEDELGPEGAVTRIREQISNAGRPQRRRLYRLHDEIARRHWGAAGPRPLTA